MTTALLRCLPACLILSLSAGVLPAQAETYRWSDPKTGQTVVSDTPPPGQVKQFSTTGDTGGGEKPLSEAARKAAANFPVILYVSADCARPCSDARQLLNQRGIPFAEKDAQQHLTELKALVGDAFVPTLLVGKQTVKGFLADTYHNQLDWAGYPGSPAR